MAEAKQLDISDISVAKMSPHIGDMFESVLFAGTSEDGIKSDGLTVRLELVDCEDRGEIECPDGPNSDATVKRSRFRLTFVGPPNTVLFDGAYDLKHADLGDIKGLSLTRDVDKDDDKVYLTAVFG